MLLNVLFLIVGGAMVIWGADKFTDGATGLARKWGVSEMVIGLTVVALGTSLPEFIVSFMSMLKGSSDMSVGNVMGSNMFNALFIVGVSVMFGTIRVDRSTAFFDLPICVLMSTLLFVLIFFDNELNRFDAFLLLALQAFYVYSLYKKSRQSSGPETAGNTKADSTMLKVLFMLTTGCGILIVGGQLMVNNAVEIAHYYGIPESIIGLTILAVGTSLPELATSMVSARKGQHGIALGNVIGSNILNVGFILGTCGLVKPMQLENINKVDWSLFIATALLIWLFGYTGFRYSRKEGVLLITIYLLYVAFLIYSL